MDPNASIDLSAIMGASASGLEEGADTGRQEAGTVRDDLDGGNDAGEEGATGEGAQDGEGGAHEELEDDDSAEWGEAPAKKDDEDDEDDDDEDPSDDRESWRKTRLNKVKAQRDAARKEIAQREADAAAARQEAARLKAELEALQSGKSLEKPGAAAGQQPAVPPTGIPPMSAIQEYVAKNDPACIALANAVQAIKQQAHTYPDAGSYNEALTEALTEYKAELRDKTREVHQHLQNQQAAVQNKGKNYVEGLVKEYGEAIEASTIPKIEVYSKRLVQHAAELHPTIREAILTHEHKDIATAAIASNKAAFDWLAEASREAGNGPLHPRAVAYVGELISAYRAQLRSAGPGRSVRASREADAAAARRSQGLPRQLRSRSTGAAQSEEQDPFLYAREVLSGRIKDPTLRRSGF